MAIERIQTSLLTLDVNGASFSFADVELQTSGYTLRWSNSGLTWNVSDTIALTITQEIPAGPSVDSITFNSAGTDGAFKTGDAVTATVTFDESVTVDTTDGTPQLTIKMGGADKVLDYSSGSPGTALVFSGYTVAANDEDTDGLSIEANKLDANGGTIQKTADATVAAVLTHAAVAASANHRVDGVKPTLVTTGDDAPKTSLDGSQIILVFSEAIGGVDRTKITVKKGTTTETTTAESINGTKVEITLTTALSTTDTNGHRGAVRGRRRRRARQRHRRGVRDVRHANPSPGQTHPDAGGEGPVHRRDGRFHGPRHVGHHEVPVPHQDHRTRTGAGPTAPTTCRTRAGRSPSEVSPTARSTRSRCAG